MDISKIPLKDSTLLEFAHALMAAEGDSFRDNYINNFFGDTKKRTSINSEAISPYEHRKIQAIWQEFFNKEEWTLTEQCDFSYTAKTPVVKFDIETSPDEYIKGYREGCLFYKKGRSKLCVQIVRNPGREEYSYIITTSETDSKLLQDLKKYASENNLYKGKKIDCRGNFLKLDNVSWEDIILPEKTKQVVRSNIEENFALRETFKKYGLSVKRGIILHGVPGTGKTKICKCLARESGYSVLYALPSDFPNPNSISRVCEIAKDLAPCLLIIEDIDWIASDRAKGGSAFVMELMNKLDGLESFGDIITLGTTNALGELENAIKNRPGRFDRIISVDKPDEECRAKMLLKFTDKFVVSKAVDFKKLASVTRGLTGAHMNDLCLTAAIFAVKDSSFEGEKLLLEKKHFDKAIKETKDKDYSTYMEQQSKNKAIGFAQMQNPLFGDFLDDDF
jgi:SpoVK/Ycf46/Vps4 family AAA+-type ATPase